jgi:hypothetical protein
VEWGERRNQLLYLVLYFISHINAKDPQLCSHKHNRGSENVYHTRVQAGGGEQQGYIYTTQPVTHQLVADVQQ